jgi:hypothetical protein
MDTKVAELITSRAHVEIVAALAAYIALEPGAYDRAIILHEHALSQTRLF